jgi:hypothetical protein
VLALLALLVVLGPIFYVLVFHPGPHPSGPSHHKTPPASRAASAATPAPTATPNASATAQAVAAIATRQAQNATATAIVGLTVTVQAQASATAGVLGTATAGSPSYNDPLNDPNNPATLAANWDQNNNCAFRSDGYHVREGINLLNFHGCAEAGKSYLDSTISVDMLLSSGHSGGLFFRVTRSKLLGTYAGYLFEVDGQGNYKISKSLDFSNPADTIALQPWSASSALKPGNTTKNTLQVIASGSTLLFYANNTFITAVTDTSYASGVIALLATSGVTSADITYSNLRVYGQAQ